MMFNYEAIAKRINLSEQRLSEIGKIIRKDFPRDEMMFELHMLRVLMALIMIFFFSKRYSTTSCPSTPRSVASTII